MAIHAVIQQGSNQGETELNFVNINMLIITLEALTPRILTRSDWSLLIRVSSLLSSTTLLLLFSSSS